MARRAAHIKGMLYAGLMIDQGQTKVLEFNCRFGDPEAQPLLMRLKAIWSSHGGGDRRRLGEITLEIDPRPTVCVVMASGGYPGPYEKGRVSEAWRRRAGVTDVVVFHAGTRKGGAVVNSGGRVLGVTAIGADAAGLAIAIAYRAAGLISWPGCYYRKDIGQKALRRLEGEKS